MDALPRELVASLAGPTAAAYIAGMFIETETTPNPSSRKFLPGREVMPAGGGTREFASPEAAEASPLAQALFDTGEVTNVLFGPDFIAVTSVPGTDWSRLKPDVLSILLDHFVSQQPLFTPGTAGGIFVPDEDDAVVDEDPADADIVAQIHELLEARVRPAVAGDGGDIRYRGFKDGVVYLTMQGACAGCPSSSATLKHGIEGLLKHYIPEVTEVRAA